VCRFLGKGNEHDVDIRYVHRAAVKPAHILANLARRNGFMMAGEMDDELIHAAGIQRELGKCYFTMEHENESA
jgi:hypothetical protein